MDCPAALRTVSPVRDIELVEDAEKADVVVVDPDGEGLPLCSLLSARGARVLVFARHPDEALILGAGVAGAIGVVSDARELLAGIRRVARGLAIAA
jgi:DNA-binding NarL/FixJ family response regulator